jgi:uncharacterized membrane protein
VSGRPDQAPRASHEGGRGAEICFLVACFEGATSAGKKRRPLSKGLEQRGIPVLEEFIFKVDGKRKVRVYDPHRTLAAALTPALTWGLFGLLAGAAGWISLVIWAVIGAICGGIYAYLKLNSLTNTQLGRIGRGLHRDSSALAVFTKAGDADAVLSSTAAYGPTTVSVAVISADLSARVIAGATDPVEVSTVRSGAEPPPAEASTLLNMLLVRQPGRRVDLGAAAGGQSPKPDPTRPEVAVVLESDGDGRLHVHDPKWGVRSLRKQSLISWGLFGVAFGLIVGFAGGGGILSSIKSGLITGIAWGIFGAIAGALVGLWAGRPVSPGRLKGMDGLVPPNSSLALAWADGGLSNEAIRRWAPPDSQQLLIRFNTTPQGIVLAV